MGQNSFRLSVGPADLIPVIFLRSDAYPSNDAVCAFLSMCFLIKDFRNYQESKTTFFIYLCSVHDLKQIRQSVFYLCP